MKTAIFFFSLILTSYLIAQYNYVFTELKGLEDKEGNTWLVNKKNWAGPGFDQLLCLYDVNNDKDTVIAHAYHWQLPGGEHAMYIYDYDFWKNEPLKYVVCGMTIYPDSHGYIILSDAGGRGFMAPIYSVEVSYQNDDLIYAFDGRLMKSTDGGLTWNEMFTIAYFPMVSLNKYDDKFLFGVNHDGHLIKSLDSGITSIVIDSTFSWNYDKTEFYYVEDQQNIYALINGKKLVRSSNNGDSWVNVYDDNVRFYFSPVVSQPNKIYLTRFNEIYESADYGMSFNLYQTLNANIAGIYKKPNSDLLYAATATDIYEITQDIIRSIKSLPTSVDREYTDIPKDFFLFQNYPNPFNSATKIRFTIPAVETGPAPSQRLITMKVYDILGRNVATLVNEEKPAGNYEVVFSVGSFGNASGLTSGVYFYKITAGEFTDIKKLILLR